MCERKFNLYRQDRMLMKPRKKEWVYTRCELIQEKSTVNDSLEGKREQGQVECGCVGWMRQTVESESERE